jgi:hypothetical protein
VLDNFEQIVAHAPKTLGIWLAAAPEMRCVVASRERLRLGVEAVLDLGPLPVPPEGDDAVILFLDRRARQAPAWPSDRTTGR